VTNERLADSDQLKLTRVHELRAKAGSAIDAHNQPTTAPGHVMPQEDPLRAKTFVEKVPEDAGIGVGLGAS